MSNRLRYLALPAVAAIALGGCVENADPDGAAEGGDAITVTSTDTECTVSTAETGSGTAQFAITNDGAKITEFYVLGDDGLRIVSERENIAPGETVTLTALLQPGSYFTACKPGMRGENVGETAFTVTGDAIELSGEDEELFAAVVQDYVNFAKNEVAELLPNVEEFAAAYADGDDEHARELFAPMRVNYERIEPIAEALGVLDPRIDYREIDYIAEAELLAEDDPTFTEWLGFHRMEKDLWVPSESQLQPDGTSAWEGWEPSTEAQRQALADTLVVDVQALYDEVHAEDFITASGISVATVSNGAAGLLEEIAVGKVTGEEDWWSHTDLWDFQANLEGSRIAFDLVAPIAESKSDEGKTLVADIDSAFGALETELAKYGSYAAGFTSYDEVGEAERKELTAKLDAVREPLSRLTNAVLSIPLPEE